VAPYPFFWCVVLGHVAGLQHQHGVRRVVDVAQCRDRDLLLVVDAAACTRHHYAYEIPAATPWQRQLGKTKKAPGQISI
jgi:hypothetical protein